MGIQYLKHWIWILLLCRNYPVIPARQCTHEIIHVWWYLMINDRFSPAKNTRNFSITWTSGTEYINNFLLEFVHVLSPVFPKIRSKYRDGRHIWPMPFLIWWFLPLFFGTYSLWCANRNNQILHSECFAYSTFHCYSLFFIFNNDNCESVYLS